MRKAEIDPELFAILQTVSDPEIPVLTVWDLGVLRRVERKGEKEVLIHLTPTYSGCPAMDTISDDLKAAFSQHGFTTDIELVLAPAWSTDDMSEEGKQKMKDYGIAPPENPIMDKAALLDGGKVIACTNCGSRNTRMVSQFGSTACKALFQCNDCLEPFDYFKCLR